MPLRHAVEFGVDNVEERLEEDDDHRADEDADGAEGLDAAEYAQKGQKRMKVRAAAKHPGLDDVVDGRNDGDAIDGQHDGGGRAAFDREEPEADRTDHPGSRSE